MGLGIALGQFISVLGNLLENLMHKKEVMIAPPF